MAIGSIFRQMSKSHSFSSTFQKLRNFNTLPTTPHHPKPRINPSQGRSISSPAETLAGFAEMVSGPQKKYNLFSDRGGFGEISRVASTAGKIADHNNPPYGISTYPALPGDSSDQFTNGTSLLPIQGMHSPLLSLEITSENTKEDNDDSVKDFKGSMSFGMLSQQEEMKLGELLVTLPPGLHEALDVEEAFYAAARSLSLDAILEYSYIAQSGKARTIKCATKKIKFAKQRKGSMKGISHRGNFVAFGNYALQVLEPAWITSKQLEAGRRALSRIVGRAAKIWVRAICDKPVTTRPAETRMGRGKGNVSFWVAVVQPGRILYEVSGVSESIAKKAITVAASKLPVHTRFIIAA
ncbi:OLC1v1003849C1 [Oldenlandia corymbosa var. corymbosa]|uniref:OLC1v1003849C1 n=1 Tax=Oldenlandia corymbosa var. corymbosa TaxID=529605 RepID=A0AAV1DCS5_OLDCO|nr:OLC1v1003849C1 [Oldenlandia corymbosa var. corymbosa]